jgi:hypothetical protein
VTVTVEYGTNPEPIRTEVSTIADLDSLLDRLTVESPTEAPYLANVIRVNGDTLTIGLGTPLLVDEAGELLPGSFEQPLTVLSFVSQSGDPPYYVSRASTPASHNFVFFMCGHWTEFAACNAIPEPLARRAVREFAASTEMPTSVEWEEV